MKNGTKLVLIALVAAVGIGGLAGCSRFGSARAVQALSGNGGFKVGSTSGQNSVGVPSPGFSGVDVVTGQSVSLAQFKGKTVLLNLVNYGCSTEINVAVSAQLVAIRDLTRQRADFVPVSVFCGCCSPEALRQFADSNDLNWPWLLDTGNSIVGAYSGYLEQFGYPTLIFIDQGQIVTDKSGALTLTELGARLDHAVLGGSSVSGQVQ